MSSEGDISTSSAGEVAIVHSDVLEIVVFALTVLSDTPIHLSTMLCDNWQSDLNEHIRSRINYSN